MQKARELPPQDQDGPPTVDRREARLQPSADRVLMYAKQHRSLFNRVAPVDLHAPRIEPLQPIEPVSMRARMSPTRHTVIRGPSFIGFGYRPDFTPAHQVDLLTGIGPPGPMMDAKRIKPDFGRATNSTSS